MGNRNQEKRTLKHSSIVQVLFTGKTRASQTDTACREVMRDPVLYDRTFLTQTAQDKSYRHGKQRPRDLSHRKANIHELKV